jgi:hypothetical protein
VGYPLGFLFWFGALILGNLAGTILASVNGWENVSYERPGGVFLAGAQAALGAFFGELYT